MNIKLWRFKSIVHRVLAGYVLAAIIIYTTSYNYAHYLIRTIVFDGARREMYSRIAATADKIDVQFSNIERDALALARYIISKNSHNNDKLQFTWQDVNLWLRDLLDNNPALMQVAIIPVNETAIGLIRNGISTALNFPKEQTYRLNNLCSNVHNKNRIEWTTPYAIENSFTKQNILLCVPYSQPNTELAGTIALEMNLDWLQTIVHSVSLENGFFNMNIGEPFLLSLTNSEWIVAPINNTLKSNLFIWTLKDDEVKPNDVSINKIEMPPFLPPQPIKNPNDYVQEYQIKTKEQNENKTGVFENKQMVEIRKEKLDVEYWIAAPLKTQPWLMSIRFPVIALDFYLQSYFSILKKSMIRDLLLLSLAIFLIIRLTTRDLRSLIKVIDNTKAGQLDTPLPKIRSQDEVGRLYLAFSKMRESLKLHIKQLHETTAAKERIESELAIAGQIQRSMVPKIDVTDSTNHCYKICAMLQPARQVGGDLYDYFLLGENKLCFVIGDVSDKGVPAALTMARVITLIRTLAKIEGSPASILIAVNETLSNGNEQCDFVTLFCAILEIDNGILEYASGGHDPPLLFRNKQTMWLELETGPAVGLFPDAEFPTHRMKLEPDDLLLLYTDGITEAMNLEGELFTSERLKSVLEQHPPTDPVRLIRSVQYFYRNFIQQAPASDDLTLLAIQHLPSNPFETKTKVTEWIITLNNELTELDRVRERLGEILFKQSLSLAFIEDMQLVAEEILVNIIEHGFYDTQGLQYIDIHLTLAENLLTLSFEDKAKPFNPLTEIPPPDLSIDAAQREAGGFGFFLVRNLVENINYANQDGKNILTISRAINSHH